MDRSCEIIDCYLDIFGNRWNLLILKQLFESPKRFNELKRELEPISQTVLTKHLRSMMSYGVIEREEFEGTPVSVYYSLTPMGYSVTPAMISTYKWIEDNVLDKENEQHRCRAQSHSVMPSASSSNQDL